MSASSSFCTKCGSQVLEGAAFCTKCGTAASSSEPVISVIPNATVKAGFMGFKSRAFTIAVTEKRVLFARITTEMMKDLVKEARDVAAAEGKGFFGQWGAQLSSYSHFAERYLSMAPDEILAQNEGNFAIDRATIQKAKVKNGMSNDDGTSAPDRLIIKTTGQKYDITLSAGAGQAKKALVAARMI